MLLKVVVTNTHIHIIIFLDVVQFQYQRALVGHQNDFVSAAHSCEAVLDKALMDGNNYPREKFLQEIDSVIGNWNNILQEIDSVIGNWNNILPRDWFCYR